MVPESIIAKLAFSEVRLGDIRDLIARNGFAEHATLRQQLSQEFLFHLVGSIEYLAQLVVERRKMPIKVADVAVHRVVKCLPAGDLKTLLASLSADTRGNSLPPDPYNSEGLVYRLINYRNEVAHRNTNPFHFVLRAYP